MVDNFAMTNNMNSLNLSSNCTASMKIDSDAENLNAEIAF